MKTTLKKLSIPKPKGGYDELYVDDFATKEELAALRDAVYKLHFDKEEVTDLHPFYVKSLEDGNTIYNSSTTSGRISYNRDKVEYSFDGTWHPLSEVENITLDNGERVYFRFLGEYLSPSNNVFDATNLLQNIEKEFEVGGDIRTIIYGDPSVRIVGESELLGIFHSQYKLINAKNLLLPFDEISEEGCAYMFRSCTSLVTAPALPATTLKRGCYSYMFAHCESLVIAPELPATTLANNCYEWMFYGCKSLTTAPKLPAMTIPGRAYMGMFSYCTSLVTAPELPALNLTENIFGSSNYAYMFEGCTSLVNAPALPATRLSSTCYHDMFKDCTSLTVAPELPAITLSGGYSDGDTSVTNGCYSNMFAGTSIKRMSLPAEHISDFAYMGMFSGCTSLEEVEIHATSVSGVTTYVTSEEGKYAGSLYNMFSGCTNLRNVFCNLKEIPTNATYNWLEGVAAEGKFVQAKGANWELSVSGIPESWVVEDWQDDYFYLECLDDEGDITLGQEFGLEDAPAEYTRNHINWTSTEEGMVISLVKGERVYLRRAYGTAFRSMSSNSPIFTTESRIKIGGNVDKLMYDFKSESVVLTEACYMCLFNSEDITCNIVDASELVLPAKELARYCYYYMFACCINLVAAPKLPAMILAESCYGSMFKQCTSLATAPELPATTLADSCYSYMFYGCKKLSYVKCNVIKYVYSDFQTNTRYWLSGVSSSGTFVKNGCFSDWTSGSSGIPSGWEVEDMLVSFKPTEKITPSGRVAFYGEEYSFVCTINKADGHLLYISKDGENWMLLPAYEAMPITQGETIYICGRMTNDFSSTNYTQFAMTGKIAASGNCNALWNYEDLNAPLKAYCGYSMFKQCTSLTTAPELPATTLADYCYSGMFTQCTSLTTAPALPATTLAIYCYDSMFAACTSLTQAPALPATTLADWCYYKMFYNCTSLTTAPELPATTLKTHCYNSMFSYCTSLNYVRALFTTKELFTVSAGGGSVAYHYTVNWLSGVSEVGTFEKNKNAAWSVNYYLTGGSGIPENWTINEV